MFNNQNVGERGGTRPFVVGLVLLLLFLSTTQDWGSPARQSTRTQLKGGTPKEITAETKEMIIKRLITSNEELEKENENLRLEIAQLKGERRSMSDQTKTDESDDRERSDLNVTQPNFPSRTETGEESEKIIVADSKLDPTNLAT